MAKQVLLEELQGCKTYLGWMIDKLSEYNSDVYITQRLSEPDCPHLCSLYMDTEDYREFVKINSYRVSRELCRLLFETDFTWLESIPDDSIRASDALEIRKIYARDVGEKAGKSERDIDRIRKSVHGKASVLEVIFSLCRHLDEMVNEDEPGTMIGFFYRILIHNLQLDEFSDGNHIVTQAPNLKEAGELSSKLEEAVLRRRAEIREIWLGRVKKWLQRDYFESGVEGGMFPLYEWKETDKDQRKVSLWYQMNAWLNEHLDDEERFVIEKGA